jgi:hypothetical protein
MYHCRTHCISEYLLFLARKICAVFQECVIAGFASAAMKVCGDADLKLMFKAGMLLDIQPIRIITRMHL